MEKNFLNGRKLKKKVGPLLRYFFRDQGALGKRGLNENSSSIVRQDLPKSTDLSVHSQKN